MIKGKEIGMKKILLGLVVVGVATVTLSARSMMPALDRVRNKVDNALRDKEQGGTMSFKDLLAQNGRVEGDGKVLNCVLSATPEKAPGSTSTASVEQILNELYWSNQIEFIEKFCQAKSFVPEQALTLLKSKLEERYAKSKAPLIDFAHELAIELQKIDTCFDTLLQMLGQRSASPAEKNNPFIEKMKELLAQREKLLYMLEKFTQNINHLLLNK
jgi:DNA-binding transcriptional regulator YhcF (GntR family)